VADEFLATGGLRIGGQGSWYTTPGERCQLEVVTAGLLAFAENLTTLMWGWYQLGLYQNDHKPVLGDTIAAYAPCDFSGYDGLRLIYGWTTPAISGVYAVSTALAISWMHNGGSVINDVWGYYVVDRGGILQFAERFCDGPFVIDRYGRRFTLSPTFRVSNEREGE